MLPLTSAFQRRFLTALILLAAAVLFFGRLGERGVVSEELRWAEIAREMRHSGDFFRPTINGSTYYDKPVGSYWLIVLASYFTGGVNETAARLPAAVAGWIGVCLTMSLGRRLYGAGTGILAGAILTTSFAYVFYSRRATADLETVVGVLAAVWLFARHERPGLWVVGLWTIMACTSLTKGLLGFALPVTVFLVYAGLVGRRDAESWRGIVRQSWLLNRWTCLALPLAAAIFLTPFAISLQQTNSAEGLALLFRENIRRFIAPHNHTGPIYLYAEVIFVLLAPWSVFLPASLLSKQPAMKGDLLARVFFWAIFAFFTLSASRRNYYILPILPAAALLIARTLLDRELSGWPRRLRSVGQGVFVVAVALAGVCLVSPADVLPSPWKTLPPLPGRGALAVGWIACLGLVGFGVHRKYFVPAAALTAFSGLAFVFVIAMPHFDALRGRDAFVAEVREQTDSQSLALFFARDIVFDLAASEALVEYRDAQKLANDLRGGQLKWVVARRRYLRDVVLPAEIVAAEPSHPWERGDQLGDKMVLLRAKAELGTFPN